MRSSGEKILDARPATGAEARVPAASRVPKTRSPLQAVERACDVLQWLLLAVVLVLGSRGRGHPRDWILLVLSLPTVRLILSARFRRRAKIWARLRWREVRAYSQESTGPPPWRGALELVVLPALLFNLASNHLAGGGDSTPALPTAVRFLTHGDFRLDDYYHACLASGGLSPAEGIPYYLRATPHGIYSNYPVGMTLLALPFTAASQLLRTEWERPQTLPRLEKWIAAWITAAVLGLFFLIALHLLPAAPALALTALLACGSSVFSSAGQDLGQHGGVLFWTLLILLIELRQSVRPTPAGALLQGAACGFSLTCRFSAGIFLFCFGVWLACRDFRRAVLVTLIGLLTFAPFAWFYYTTYGSLLGPTDAQASARSWAGTAGAHLAGVLFSPSRGLFIYHPWLLLIVFVPFARSSAPERAAPRRIPAGWNVFLLAVLLLQTVLVSSWNMWWGGHSWGPRLLTEVIPFGALLCAGPLARLWRLQTGRAAVALLGLLAALVHLPGVYGDGLGWNSVPNNIDAHPERLWSWRDAPFFFPLKHGW